MWCVRCESKLAWLRMMYQVEGTSRPTNKRLQFNYKTLLSQCKTNKEGPKGAEGAHEEAMRSTAETWTGSHLFGATTSLFVAFVPTPRSMCRGVSLRIMNDRLGFGCVRTRIRRRDGGDTPTAGSAAAKTSTGESIRTGGGGSGGGHRDSNGGALGQTGRAERTGSGTGANAGLACNGQNPRQASRRARPSPGKFIDAVRPLFHTNVLYYTYVSWMPSCVRVPGTRVYHRNHCCCVRGFGLYVYDYVLDYLCTHI